MSTTTKIWADHEPKPEGTKLSKFDENPEVPPGWFREDPEYAAELYVLEIHKESKMNGVFYTIYVEDDSGVEHEFVVTARRELTTHVKKVR